MISTKFKKKDFELLFPNATTILSKRKTGINHYVVFDKRPNTLFLEIILNHDKSVILVCPSNFSPQIFEKSLYKNLFLDIVFKGNVEYDPFKNSELIKLYLFINFKRNNFKSISKAITEINETINYISVLNYVSTEQLFISLISIIQKNYLPEFTIKDFYLGVIDTFNSIPKGINDLMSKKKISKEDYLKLLLDIIAINTSAESQDRAIFFYIDNGLYYKTIISTLLKHQNSDLNFLVEKCRFLSWVDYSSNKIVFKLIGSKKYNVEILHALQNINECLKTYFSKSIISPSEKDLIYLKEKYKTEKVLLNNLDVGIFKSFILFFKKEEYSEYNLMIFYIGIINSFIKDNSFISEDHFLNYLYTNWIASIKTRNYQTKNYQSYSDAIKSYVEKIKIKQKFFSIYTSTNKKEIYLLNLSTTLRESITKEIETDNYSLQFNNKLHLLDGIHLKDNSKYTYPRLKKNLDKVADCIGLDTDMKILCSYIMLNKEIS